MLELKIDSEKLIVNKTEESNTTLVCGDNIIVLTKNECLFEGELVCLQKDLIIIDEPNEEFLRTIQLDSIKDIKHDIKIVTLYEFVSDLNTLLKTKIDNFIEDPKKRKVLHSSIISKIDLFTNRIRLDNSSIYPSQMVLIGELCCAIIEQCDFWDIPNSIVEEIRQTMEIYFRNFYIVFNRQKLTNRYGNKSVISTII